MGVAYHANHFIWFEVGRTDYCRNCGFTYAQMERDTGTRMMVVEARCRYKGSVFYDEELWVRTWIKSLRKRVLIFGYLLIRKSDGTVVAEGENVHVTTDSRGKPCSIPECYLALLQEVDHTR
jgi:acyl-CoA thioester hydrolase